jgi:hypothetical protein
LSAVDYTPSEETFCFLRGTAAPVVTGHAAERADFRCNRGPAELFSEQGIRQGTTLWWSLDPRTPTPGRSTPSDDRCTFQAGRRQSRTERRPPGGL